MSAGRGGWLSQDPVRARGRLQFGALVALALTGIALIALPDSDDRVLTLSPEHGPAPLDLLGSALLTAAWLGILARPLAIRQRVAARMGERGRSVCLFSAGLGAGLLVASIFSQVTWWWVIGAALLAGIQLYAVALSWRSGSERHQAHSSRAL